MGLCTPRQHDPDGIGPPVSRLVEALVTIGDMKDSGIGEDDVETSVFRDGLLHGGAHSTDVAGVGRDR